MVTKQKILIVDDDENIAELISLYLTKECFETKIVYDGESALDALPSFKPNLILLDASHVTILIRGEDFSCAETVAKAAKEHPKITVLPQTEVVKVSGNDSLLSITYRNKRTGKETTFAPENDTFGVFVFAGYEPETSLLQGKAARWSGGWLN